VREKKRFSLIFPHAKKRPQRAVVGGMRDSRRDGNALERSSNMLSRRGTTVALQDCMLSRTGYELENKISALNNCEDYSNLFRFMQMQGMLQEHTHEVFLI
jgi:hypothetical protein